MRDKNRPKGPMSAYACFVQVIREEHKKKHPSENVVFSEFTKKCAEKWKQMTAKEKKRFDDMAQLDKDRYNREIHDYIPPEGFRKGKKRKRTKDPSMPKRAWSAFFFFCDEFRPKIREAHPVWKVSDVAKELGKLWEDCVEKTEYEKKAAADKQRYEEDMQKYRQGVYVPVKRPRVAAESLDVAAPADVELVDADGDEEGEYDEADGEDCDEGETGPDTETGLGSAGRAGAADGEELSVSTGLAATIAGPSAQVAQQPAVVQSDCGLIPDAADAVGHQAASVEDAQPSVSIPATVAEKLVAADGIPPTACDDDREPVGSAGDGEAGYAKDAESTAQCLKET